MVKFFFENVYFKNLKMYNYFYVNSQKYIKFLFK